MDKVKSLEDLKRIREEALKKRQAKNVSGQKEIVVGMGTVGIAAGARQTLKAILEYIEEHNLTDIVVRQTGNIGLDSMEPIVQVSLGEGEKVTYGKVTPEIARQIMAEHVVGGSVVKAFVVQS
ncbi:(2Fe-2S) ferredoxin domain-containing protein [Levilinea saccharolytica]|uniref:NADH dehydrogenase n=1 Tax=Levilinea saccharolytica TaxID=229921 RepID=A0A0P6YBQ2_9CHLR|nr:(2Fe-2S) ferredoxin domain-containing protein [Levilinea saccharolytica]KPL86900.1 NADH dehydrogenase [Levilinea saccharolytica]GAP17815.1 NAD(P)-dependent iron-only hydrogenase iron-sulfur protein [Levilinea saccharolytica]